MPGRRTLSRFSVREDSHSLVSSVFQVDFTVYSQAGSSQPTKYMMCQPWIELLSFLTIPVSPGWRAGSRAQFRKLGSRLSVLEMPVYRPPVDWEPLSSVFWTARAAKLSSVASPAFH